MWKAGRHWKVNLWYPRPETSVTTETAGRNSVGRLSKSSLQYAIIADRKVVTQVIITRDGTSQHDVLLDGVQEEPSVTWVTFLTRLHHLDLLRKTLGKPKPRDVLNSWSLLLKWPQTARKDQRNISDLSDGATVCQSGLESVCVCSH